MTDKLTLDEVRRMFGGTISKTAMDLISAANDDLTLDDLRPDLEALAASENSRRRKRSFGVLFGKELNGKGADGQG